MATSAVHVRGLAELNRTFRQMPDDVRKELRTELREAAEPVRARAEDLASQDIENIGDRWGRMRVGVTPRIVYVAPRQRGSRRGLQKRPNLAGLLATRAMEPALEQERGNIEDRLERMLDRIGRHHGF